MDKQMMDIFCKLLDVELDKISKMPSLNDATLNNLHKLTDTKKNLLKIEKLEMELGEGDMEGYSSRGNGGMSQRNTYDYGSSNRYPHMPIYGDSYDYGYSRDDSRSHLEAAMRDARNEQEREEIRQLMTRYHY